MQQTSHRIYAFSDFALDLTTGCLRREGEEVKLRPKAFKTLRYLVENSNRLVSKDELVKAVWADAFVTDNSLVQCLKEVRAALQDDTHRLIKTVPRRGYIFAAEVNDRERPGSQSIYAEQFQGIKIVIEDVVQSETANQFAEPLEAINSSRQSAAKSANRISDILKPQSLRLAIGVLALTLLAAGVGYLWWAKTSSLANRSKAFAIGNIKLTTLTSTGEVYGSSISPNGQFLLHNCIKPGVSSLLVEQIATGSMIEIHPPISADLRSKPSYWSAVFSADSNYIYYILADDGENHLGTLFRAPVLGGYSQKILNHVNSGGYESPDGQRIAYIRANQIPGLFYLMTCSRDGTDEQIISSIDTNSQFVSLDWSPDGQNLLYGFRQYTSEGYFHYLAEIPATGGDEHRLTEAQRERIIAAQWLPDKSGVIMNAIDPQTQLAQIYYISYPDGARQRITNDLNNYKGISIADNSRIITQLVGGTTNLWLMPLGHAKEAVSLASSTRGWYQGVSWTADHQLVYTAGENGVQQICKMAADGSQRQQLTNGPGYNADPAVSPDGRHIVFFSTRSGSGQIWRMTTRGDDLRQLTHSTVGVFSPKWSPDGQWVYYSADVKGKWQVWKVAMSGGEAQLVESSPVQLWAISPDGKLLAYSFFDEQTQKIRVAVRRLDSLEPWRYFDIPASRKLEWTADGRGLTYVNSQSANTDIWLQPLDGKVARPLTALTADQWTTTYAWSPDGKTLAYTRMNSTFDTVLIEMK